MKLRVSGPIPDVPIRFGVGWYPGTCVFNQLILLLASFYSSEAIDSVEIQCRLWGQPGWT